MLISAQAGSAREDNRAGGDCLAELILLTIGRGRWECSLGRRCSQNQKPSYGAGVKIVLPETRATSLEESKEKPQWFLWALQGRVTSMFLFLGEIMLAAFVYSEG